jgi:hypothetical protein
MTTGKPVEREETVPLLSESDRWSVVSAGIGEYWELAKVLGEGDVHVVQGGLRDACIAARADFLVQRRLTSFDLVSVAVPHDFDQETVGSVVAAVSGGPHSLLAARVARKIADAVGTEAAMITVSHNQDNDTVPEEVLERIGHQVPGLTPSVVQARSAKALVATLEPNTLLIIGAPGGSWVQKQLLGPGHQIRRATPGGVIVVRSAVPRCFQKAAPGVVVSPWLRMEKARRIVGDTTAAPVVANGSLVGIVRRSALHSSPPETRVETVMEEAVFVLQDDPIDVAAHLRPFLEDAPVPVVDKAGNWMGSI